METYIGHIRNRHWQRLTRGLYQPAPIPDPPQTTADLAAQLRAWQLTLPEEAAFTHLTAAQLSGWWLPHTIPHPHFVAMRNGDSHPRRPGLQVCRHTKPFDHAEVDGLRVTTPAETLLAASRDVGILDLVIMGDSALRLGHCTVDEIERVARRRRRGAPQLRTVVGLLDSRSESPWESVMRVLHGAAEVEVEPQYEVFDELGRQIARGDLWVVGTRRLQEYDGEVHRLQDVHENDLDRERRLLQADWKRYGYTSQPLLHHGAAIIADLDRTLGRPWKARRLQAWQHLVDHSLFGRPGRARAYGHWGL